MSKEIKQIPVIIDTDPGVDDICAILLALASPELHILAITITFGNTDVEHSYENVRKIWHVMHKHIEKHPEDSKRFPIFAPDFVGSVPFLARGSDGPLEGGSHNAQYFHGRDGLSEISTRHPEFSIPDRWRSPRLMQTDHSAIDLSLDLIKQHLAHSITYIALGPLTNLARMVRKDPMLVREKIGRVIAMGGTLEAAGNITAVAEFNFYADPFAVRELLHPPGPSLGLPLNRFILLPLDITSRHEIGFSDYKEFIDPEFGTTSTPSRPENKSPLVHFVSSFLEQTVEVMNRFGVNAMELHDPMVVWCAICNPPVADEKKDGPLLLNQWKAKKKRFQVERTGEITRGMLVVDRRQEVWPGDYQEGEDAFSAPAVNPKIHHAAALEAEPKEHEEELLAGVEGVAVVTETPGSDALVRFMMNRIWGVE